MDTLVKDLKELELQLSKATRRWVSMSWEKAKDHKRELQRLQCEALERDIAIMGNVIAYEKHQRIRARRQDDSRNG